MNVLRNLLLTAVLAASMASCKETAEDSPNGPGTTTTEDATAYAILEAGMRSAHTDSMYLQAGMLKATFVSQAAGGDYQRACQTASQLNDLRDSISEIEKRENISRLQKLYAAAVSQERNRQPRVLIMWTLLILSTLSSLRLLFARKKERMAMRKIREELNTYQFRLEELKRQNQSDSDNAKRLKSKIESLQRQSDMQLANGKERYEEIAAGGTTLKWNRDDFADCVEYYRTIDAPFVAHMECDYKKLSAKYIFFAIMQHIGKSDEELQTVLVVSSSSVRSIRSRINSQKR